MSSTKISIDTIHRGRKLKRSQNDHSGLAAIDTAGLNKSSSYLDFLAEMDGYCIVELLRNSENQHDERGDGSDNASVSSLISEADDVGVGAPKPSTLRRVATSSAVAANVQDSLQRRGSTSQIVTPSQDSELVPPKKVTELWDLVAQGINMTIAKHENRALIEMVHDALESAKKYFVSSSVCREFVDNNLCKIVNIMLSLSADVLSSAAERVNVERTIRFALQLINQDLRRNAHKFTVTSHTVDALVPIFDYKEAYYEVNPSSRMDKILSFQRIKGFYQLSIYFNARCGTSLFPGWHLIHRVLVASYQCTTSLRDNDERKDYLFKSRNESTHIALGVMKHLRTIKLETLASVEVRKLSTITLDLLTLSQEHAYADANSMVEYIAFCQDFVLKLLAVKSPEHNEFGLELLHTLFGLVHATGPVKSAYNVQGAGLITCDGLYTLSSPSKDQDGYLIPSHNVRYVRKIKATNQQFVLFLDSALDVKRTWSLSEEFNHELGGPEYKDYYISVSRRVQYSPPLSGWKVASQDGRAPGPVVEPLEDTLPVRDEHATLMHDVLHWFIEKNVLQLVLGMDGNLFPHSFFMMTIDALMNGKDFASDEMVLKLRSILPKTSPHLTNEDISSIKLMGIEAAKRSVASAGRCTDDVIKQQAMLDSVNQALGFLASLERASKVESAAGGVQAETLGALIKINAMESPAPTSSTASKSFITTDSTSSDSQDENEFDTSEAPIVSITTRTQVLMGTSMTAGRSFFLLNENQDG
ncbi:hypothetical protein ACHAWO_009757 [Cyclotella atomus]|uniref:Uncharacterized protein n=1 Tax=Cyclotella atomus TaxID=382360 RepID=A0ABD3NIT9_9STRA